MHLAAAEFKQWKDEQRRHLLIDIRENYEIEQCSIGGLPIAMEKIIAQCEQFPSDQAIVIHCNSGKRSDAVVYALRQRLNRTDIFSLDGGIQNYAQQFEPQLNCAS